MGLVVTAPFSSITIAADSTLDLWSLMSASGRQIRLLAWEITSDAIAASLTEVTLRRITATGSVGNIVVETKVDPSQTATISGVVRTADTTQGTSPGDVLAGYAWEQLGYLGHIYIPESRFLIPATDGIALIATAVNIAFKMSGYVTWEEI